VTIGPPGTLQISNTSGPPLTWFKRLSIYTTCRTIGISYRHQWR